MPGPDGVNDKIIVREERAAQTQLEQYLKTDQAKRLTSLKAWMIILVGVRMEGGERNASVAATEVAVTERGGWLWLGWLLFGFLVG